MSLHALSPFQEVVDMNRLTSALFQIERILKSEGITLSYDDTRWPSSHCAFLDSASHIGTITFWPKALFEFQFNSTLSGDVVLLETHEFPEEDDLVEYLTKVVTRL